MNSSKKHYVGVGDFKVSKKMRENILDILETGRISYGPYISRFESEFSRLHESSFGIMSNSGTSSLQIALQTLKIHHNWQDGDEVIIPATTFIATANIVLHNNMKPVFVDIEPDYYGIDPNLIEEKITDKTRCIIPVHLFGLPCQMDKIMTIASKYNLKIIEDSCETLFANFNGKSVGSFGDIGCFSTYVAHTIVTGVGGIAITSNSEYAVTMRSLVNHGRDSIYINIDDDVDKTSNQLREIIDRRFSFIYPGHSFRVTEFEGALGVAQLEERNENIPQRQNNAKFLTDYLSAFSEELQLPITRPNSTHTYMVYPIVLKKESKEKICNYLENRGIETRDMMPLINHHFIKNTYNIKKGDYPVSDQIIERGFYIGCHPGITPILLNHIGHTFSNYYSKNIIDKPATISLIAITSKDIELSQKIFSNIDKSTFNNIMIFDFYPDNELGDKFREMKYDVIDMPKKSLLEVYKIVLDKIQDENIVIITLDGSQDPFEIPAITSHLLLGYDMVIASRFMPGGKRFDSDNIIPLRGLGNRLITLMLNLVFNANLTDSFQPFRAVSIEFLKSARLTVKNNTNYQLSIKAVSMNKKIFEIPSVERKAIKQIGFLKAVWIGLMAILVIIAEKLRRIKL